MSSVLGESGLFVGSLVLMSVSSFALTVALERVGVGLRLSEGLLGILTALGADAPEISSSIAAVSSGHHDLGLGVVLGSNIFNLAALFGLSAIITRKVRVNKASTLFHGGIALLATLVIGLLLLAVLSAWPSLLFLGLLLAIDIAAVALSPGQLKRLCVPSAVTNFLELAKSGGSRETYARKARRRPPSWIGFFSYRRSLRSSRVVVAL